jgi:hypothetical protein
MAQAFVELEAQDEVRNLAHAEWLALLLDRFLHGLLQQPANTQGQNLDASALNFMLSVVKRGSSRGTK